MRSTDVVWMPNDTATRQHAVNADTVVPRGAFRIPTICRPASLTALLPPGKVLGAELPKCRGCLNRLVEDPPPPGVPQPQDPRAARAEQGAYR